LDGCHKLDAVRKAAEEERLEELLLPLGFGLDFPHVHLTTDQVLRFGFGQKVILHQSMDLGLSPDITHPLQEGMLAQAFGQEGEFSGLIRYLGEAGDQNSLWKAEKWFINT
jgi:hypothetical protein